MQEPVGEAGGWSSTRYDNPIFMHVSTLPGTKLDTFFFTGEYILYHGTSLKNAMQIIRNGFDKSKIKSLPVGFYLATWPEVPLRYGGPDGTVVLVCKVILGKHWIYLCPLRYTILHV